MGLHRVRRRYRIPVLAGALAVVLVAAIAAVVLHRAPAGAAAAGVSARHADPARSVPPSAAAQASSAAPTPTPSPTPKPKPRPRPPKPAGADGPPASVAGWKMVYSQNFSGSGLPSNWGAYSGQPGGDPDGQWDTANAVVRDGSLDLLATSQATGGVMYYGNPQAYGMYLVRMKGDDEPGLKISDIALLWPSKSVWPPEIDFYEDGGGSRDVYQATVHPGPDGDNSVQVHRTVDSNATQWHTYGVQWTPTTITFTIDGRPAAAVVRNSGLPAWPDIPMNLALQSQNLGQAQPGHTIVTMTVDWVAEYAMS